MSGLNFYQKWVFDLFMISTKHSYNFLMIVFHTFILIWCAISCGKHEPVNENYLVRVGEKMLTEDEIINKIPQGLQPADSCEMFNALTDEWIKDELLADFAEERLYDIKDIERKVAAYRNKLIIQEYLMKMRESRQIKTDEKEVKTYYDSHKEELVTEVPLVKGIFLKIDANVSREDEIKRLMTSQDEADIDNLEKEWMDKALEYEYFKDRWIDWETISGMIPYRFGDPDLFLENNRYFEINYGDCAYYLSISDYLPSGSSQPYEYASLWIANILHQDNLNAYEKTLVESLLKKAIKEKKLEYLNYNPLNRQALL